MDRGKLEKGLEINDKIADIKKDRTIIEGYLEESILNMSKGGRVSRIFKKGCNLSALKDEVINMVRGFYDNEELKKLEKEFESLW